MKDKSTLVNEWQRLSGEIATGMAEWREQHPKATLREIEKEVDRRLSVLRAQMLEDTAQQSGQREWQAGADGAPRCPSCGRELQGRAQEERQLQTDGQRVIVLKRQYGVCPQCGQGFFPPWMKR